MKYIKVKDKDNLERDMSSNGIVNTDIHGYEEYTKEYLRKYTQSQKISNLENNVNELKNDLDEIKNLLRSLIDGPK